MGLGGLSTKQLGTSVGQALRFCVLLPRSKLISFLQHGVCCGRLHEKCCVAHACSVLHSLEEPAPLPTSLWSCPDLWHESVACIVTGEIHKPSQEEVDPLFAVWHDIPRFLFHLCQTLLRVCGHAQTFGTSLRPVLSMTICTDSRPFKI